MNGDRVSEVGWVSEWLIGWVVVLSEKNGEGRELRRDGSALECREVEWSGGEVRRIVGWAWWRAPVIQLLGGRVAEVVAAGSSGLRACMWIGRPR